MYQAEFDTLSTGQAERALLKVKHISYEQGEKTSRALAHSLRLIFAANIIDQINSDRFTDRPFRYEQTVS